MSALARVLSSRGANVTGSDRAASPTLVALEQEIGHRLFVGHEAQNVATADLVVASAAIADDNPELAEARRRGIPILSRAAMLGNVMDLFSTRVAVAGTHGKTTTSAMAAQMLTFAGKDPTALIGADVPAWKSNTRVGSSNVVVAEACEAYGSFLDIRPTHTIVTNIEADHLDYYADFDAIVAAFRQFAARTTEQVIVCADGGADKLIASAAEGKLLTYGLESGEITASVLGQGRFAVKRGGKSLGEARLRVPGRHNVLNALSVIALGIGLEIPFDSIAKGVGHFEGTSRRFEILLSETLGLTVIDDYAHHPTEIRATLAAARASFPGRRIVALFQPHLPSRTRDLMDEFAQSFGDADLALFTDIYLAREQAMPGITSQRLTAVAQSYRGAEHAHYAGDLAAAENMLRGVLKEGDIFLTLGAGDVRIVADGLVAKPPRLLSRDCEWVMKSEDEMSNKMNVVIVTGGRSSERDISLITAQRIQENLDPDKYAVTTVDSADPIALLGLARQKPDVAFVAQHGKGGEDGAIQGLLEILGIPYTGSGILASALALDKLRCKDILAASGIPLARHVALFAGEKRGFQGEIALPIVVKPNSAGSSDGVSIVRTESGISAAIDLAFRFDSTVLIEEFCPGMEITGGILGNENLESLPLVEIIPVNEFYDREAKYTPGMTEEICPARLPDDVTARALQIARDCHRIIGCRGMSRTDMMVSEQGDIRVIEVNTIPGMTSVSLLPFAALNAGYSFPNLLDQLIAFALEDASQ
jgi:UDP-N-acetylmuramate--alanine ligase